LGVFTVYLDDSGTHATSDVVVVAGFVSEASRWEQFSHEWQAALDCYNLDYFRMADFESSQGQFKDWKGQQRKKRFNRFLGIIKKYVLTSVGWAIPRSSFDVILSDLAKRICGDAYGLAALACFRSLAQLAIHPEVDGWFRYVLESGTRGRDALSRIHAEGRKEID
jgi:hypothetical protein